MRFSRGLTAGLLIGAAAGIIMMPQLDGKTRRRMNRASKKIAHKAGDFFGDMIDKF